MGLIRPVTRTVISTTDFGQPVYDWIMANAITPWVNLPLSNGWVTTSAAAAYCKIGPVTYLRGSVGSGTSTPGTVIGTLPAGFRSPVSLQRATVYFYAQWYATEIDIYPDGRITMGATAPVGTPNYLSLDISFVNV